jgi:actin-related protein 10
MGRVLRIQVYHSRPLFHLARATPLAGRRLHRRLKALLRTHARYYPAPASLSTTTRSAVPVPRDVLSDELIQQVIRQGSFVGDPPRPDAASLELEEDRALTGDEGLEEISVMRWLKAKYEPAADATDLRLTVKPRPHDAQDMGPATLVVPGWVRERAAEVLFGDEDGEAEAIQDAVLQCLLRVRCFGKRLVGS